MAHGLVPRRPVLQAEREADAAHFRLKIERLQALQHAALAAGSVRAAARVWMVLPPQTLGRFHVLADRPLIVADAR